MHVDLKTIDRQMAFLADQSARLRKLNARWAEGNAEEFDLIRDTLRQLRAEHQMTGIGGRRLEG
jgi:hypothetical protein